MRSTEQTRTARMKTVTVLLNQIASVRAAIVAIDPGKP